MARNLDEWLSTGIHSMMDGTYNPRFLKRIYFQDEMIDQLHLSDRILQNLLLKQLKPTFSHVMSPNCYHLHGPSGVKLATQRIKEALETQKPQYIIRADIKSYYKSIQHHLLLRDIKHYYHDPNVQLMLENIIKNPIETPCGYKNPDNGIALRGPLSQFFSALYLKPLDHAFDEMDVTYLRYQDDIIVLCRTKRQMERCKQRLMAVLSERKLRLSRKKTRIGAIHQGFHFLGIHYLETQPPNGANVTREHQNATEVKSVKTAQHEHFLPESMEGETGSSKIGCDVSLQSSIVLHARTLRKAREQVKQMVADGFSTQKIKRYLARWCAWWVRTVTCWTKNKLPTWFLEVCWDAKAACIASAQITSQHILDQKLDRAKDVASVQARAYAH